MARNGLGIYQLPAGNPVVTGTPISSTVQNTTMTDVANALTTSICTDGQTPMAANLQMGGNKLIGLAAGALPGDSARYDELILLAPLALSRRIAPNFVNSSAMVQQRITAGTLSTARVIGPCDNIGVWASGGAVSAGTITQITIAISGTTGYACRAAGVTLTGSGQISHSIRMEARDALKYKNKTVSFSVVVDHDVGSNINYTLVAKKPTVADNFATITTISTSTITSVITATATKLTFNAVALGDVSNGLELEVQAACGAVTTKNFNVTEFYVNIEAVAGTYDVPDYETELARCQRYLPALANLSTIENIVAGECYGTGNAAFFIPFPLYARVSITGMIASAAGNFSLTSSSLGAVALTSFTYNSASIRGCTVLAAVAAGLVAGNATILFFSTAGSQILFTGAEL